MLKKIRYEIDPHRRLVATAGGMRQVLDGTFKISADNELVYHVKRPVAADAPQQVRCRGTWSLDTQHRLVFSLDKWDRRVAGGKLVLETEVLSASGPALVFTLTGRDADAKEKMPLLTFGGSWQVDSVHRLNFLVDRGSGPPDCLRFRGSWAVNRNHELTYLFSGAGRNPQMLEFKGSWGVSGRSVRLGCNACADTLLVLETETAAKAKAVRWININPHVPPDSRGYNFIG